ncbi:hypothetical protein [Mucilaginibacter ginsenosidivorax]|uniref:Uncharacterized protein n=1 Tax=Mucilaginibacter ginsenosidivorax TaxID=862126 RepID=A0A5B8W126_9SPHI|nr:hypothetical protein [Mucilaginibacter ginsenosidivorax]QEC77383.1 hypothetical protein FSB76_16035 [Mucilaginibacter ginsenosidivorax]
MSRAASNSLRSRNWGRLTKWIANFSAIVAILTFLLIYLVVPDFKSMSDQLIVAKYEHGKFVFWRNLDLEILGGGDSYIQMSALVVNTENLDTCRFLSSESFNDGIYHEFRSIKVGNQNIAGHFKFTPDVRNSMVAKDGISYKITFKYDLTYKFLFFTRHKSMTERFIFVLPAHKIYRSGKAISSRNNYLNGTPVRLVNIEN